MMKASCKSLLFNNQSNMTGNLVDIESGDRFCSSFKNMFDRCCWSRFRAKDVEDPCIQVHDDGSGGRSFRCQ
jgi:hypothetical protein